MKQRRTQDIKNRRYFSLEKLPHVFSREKTTGDSYFLHKLYKTNSSNSSCEIQTKSVLLRIQMKMQDQIVAQDKFHQETRDGSKVSS